jgi:hypothetical protein
MRTRPARRLFALLCALPLLAIAAPASAQQLRLPTSGVTIQIPAELGAWEAGGDAKKGVDLLKRQSDPLYAVMLATTAVDQQTPDCATALRAMGPAGISSSAGWLSPEWHDEMALSTDEGKQVTIVLGCAQTSQQIILGIFTYAGAAAELKPSLPKLSGAIARGFGAGKQAPVQPKPQQPVAQPVAQGQTLTLPTSKITLTMPANTGSWQAGSKDGADVLVRSNSPQIAIIISAEPDPQQQVCPSFMAEMLGKAPNSRRDASGLFTSAWYKDAIELRNDEMTLIAGCVHRSDNQAAAALITVSGKISDADLYNVSRGLGQALLGGQAPAANPVAPQQPQARSDFDSNGGTLGTGNFNPPPVSNTPPVTPPPNQVHEDEEDEEDTFSLEKSRSIALTPHMFLLLPTAPQLKGLLGLGVHSRFAYRVGDPFGFLMEGNISIAEDSVTKLFLDAHAAAGLALNISEYLYLAALGTAGVDGFGVASLSSDDAAGSYEFPFKTYYGAQARVGLFGAFTLSGMLAIRPDRTEQRFALDIPISGPVALQVTYNNYKDAKSYGIGAAIVF